MSGTLLLLVSSFALGLLLSDAAFSDRRHMRLSAAARMAFWAVSLLGYVVSLSAQIVLNTSAGMLSASMLLYLGPLLTLLLLPLIWRQLPRSAVGGERLTAVDSGSARSGLADLTNQTDSPSAQQSAGIATANQASPAGEAEAERAPTPPLAGRSRLLLIIRQALQPQLRAARQSALCLQRTSPVAEDAQQHYQHLQAALDSADALLESMNQLIGLDDGLLQPRSTPICSRVLCQSLCAPFAALAEQRLLELRWRAADLMLMTDPGLLHQTLRPLLSNALRFTRYGGVLLAIRRRGEQALIQVWDTGLGLPGEQIERAFDEFETLDSASPWGEQGLGLGLALSRRLAERLNLSLRLRSRLGRGSLIELMVPLAAPAVADVHDIRGSDAKLSPIAQTLQVLCLDQEAKHLAELVARLSGWAVSVDAAADLEQALLCLDQRPADLLLVDHQPDAELDGFALIEILIRQRQLIPAYALLAAEIDETLQQRADGAGIPLLSKPVRPEALRALLEATVSNRG